MIHTPPPTTDQNAGEHIFVPTGACRRCWARGIGFCLLCFCLLSFLLGGSAWAAKAAPGKEKLYLQAMKAWKGKALHKAKARFQQVLQLLKREQAKARPRSRAWHALTLGRGSIMRKLGQIAWQRQKRRRACQHYQRITSLQSTLPPDWRRWSNPFLQREVLSAARDLRGPCTTVPSLVRIVTTPTQAKLARQQNKRWQPLPNKRIETTQHSLTLRLSAQGFLPLTTTIKIQRWRARTYTYKLTRKPKVVVPKRRTKAPRRPPPLLVRKPPKRPTLPPPPTPFYRAWWFWTATGIVAAGATTALVLIVTMQPEHVLKGNNENQPHHIW